MTDRQPDLAPEAHNSEQDDEDTQAQSVADEALNRAAAGSGDAGEELARRRGRDVVDGDEIGLQMLERLLQGLGRRARDEELALVAADLPADFFLLGGEVVVLVFEQLGGERGLGGGRGGVFGGGAGGPSLGRSSTGFVGLLGSARAGETLEPGSHPEPGSGERGLRQCSGMTPERVSRVSPLAQRVR